MAGPRNERDRGSEEDLFEDLDQFFAPLDESEWAEGDAEPAAEPPSPAEPADAEAVEADLGSLEIDIPAEDELLAGIDEGSPPGDAPEPPAEPPAEPPTAEPPAPETDEVSLAELEMSEVDPDAVGTEGEPVDASGPATSEEEMGLERWDLGADEDWAAAAAQEEGSAPEQAEEAEPFPAAPGAEPPEPAEPLGDDEPVTLDDLQVPPPQYADLPGSEEVHGEEVGTPPGGTAVGAAAGDETEVGSLDDLEDLPAGPAGDQDVGEPTFPHAPFDAEAPAAVEAPGTAPPGDAEPASVEEAADHFAEAIPPEEIERDLLADLAPPGDQRVRIDTEGAGASAAGAAAATSTPGRDEAVQPEDSALGPPTWEEAGARPVEPEPEEAAAPAPAGRNLVAAFASGLLLAAMVIALLVIGKGPFAVFAGVVVLFGQAEFYAVMRARGYKPATLMGLVAGALMLAGAYLRGDAAVLFGVFVATSASALWYMAGSPATRSGSTANIAVTLLGVLYVPGLASFAFLLLALPGDLGRNVFLVVVGLTILYDVCAYAVGSWFGNRPLAPTISPSKSWEGAWGATVLVGLISIAAVPAVDPFTSSTAVGLAILISIAAPIGDLIESAFKRDLRVKDMGTILPGHGGVLDRIDAILLSAPVAYYFLRIAFL